MGKDPFERLCPFERLRLWQSNHAFDLRDVEEVWTFLFVHGLY